MHLFNSFYLLTKIPQGSEFVFSKQYLNTLLFKSQNCKAVCIFLSQNQTYTYKLNFQNFCGPPSAQTNTYVLNCHQVFGLPVQTTNVIHKC